MRRSASEILRNLESRIARLEGRTARAHTNWIDIAVQNTLDKKCTIKGFRTWRDLFKSLDGKERTSIRFMPYGKRSKEMAALIEQETGERNVERKLNDLYFTLEDLAIDSFETNYNGDWEWEDFQEEGMVDDRFYATITHPKFN